MLPGPLLWLSRLFQLVLLLRCVPVRQLLKQGPAEWYKGPVGRMAQKHCEESGSPVVCAECVSMPEGLLWRRFVRLFLLLRCLQLHRIQLPVLSVRLRGYGLRCDEDVAH